MASNADVTNISTEWKEQLKEFVVPDFSPDSVRERLGSGLYGESCVVTNKGVAYLTKKINISIFSKDEFRSNFAKDCLGLGRLHHPNVVHFLGVQIGDSFTPPVLISELHPLSLSTCIQRYPEIPTHSKYLILLETAVGVDYLHRLSPPVIHGHLSPNNILLTEGLHAKIADCMRFGLNISSPSNTPYQAPEATQVAARDVFSLGDIMLLVALQRDPSPLEYKHHRNPENKNEPFILSEIKRRENFLVEVEESHQLKGLILRCLDDEPSQRPPIEELIHELNKMVQELEPEYTNILEMFMALGQLSLMKDSVLSLEETVKAKEEEIEALKQQMEPLRVETEAKDEVMAAQKQEMEGYKQALQSKEGRIKAHETGVRAKEALIKAKDREIAAKKQVINTKESLLKSANKRIGVLEQHVKTSRKKGSTSLPPLPLPPPALSPSEPKSMINRSLQSSPENSDYSAKPESGLRPVHPYRGTRGTTSPLHSQDIKLQRSNSLKSAPSQADPKLAKILARQQQKISENLDCIHEKKDDDKTASGMNKVPLRKRSKTLDSTGGLELKRILQKRKSVVEDDTDI